MYEHHRQSAQKMLEYYREDPENIAIILGGSVAKELARPDSDIDAIVVVTDAKYERLKEQNHLDETVFGHCTYESGYFDTKFCTRDFIKTAAERGSEPARNAFLKCKCLYARDPEIEDMIKAIPVFQKELVKEKIFAFYGAFWLSRVYFWNMSENDRFLRLSAATDLVHYGLRMILEEAGVLYPCRKSLVATVSKLENIPEDLIPKAYEFLEKIDEETRDSFCDCVLDTLEFKPPEELSVPITVYTNYAEQWWYDNGVSLSEW